MRRQQTRLVVGLVIAVVVIVVIALVVSSGEDKDQTSHSQLDQTATSSHLTVEAGESNAMHTADAQTSMARTQQSLTSGTLVATEAADLQTADAATALSQTLTAGQGIEPDNPGKDTPSPIMPPNANIPTATVAVGGLPSGGGVEGQQVASVDFTVVSEAGEHLGSGTVELFSPSEMKVNESAEIVVELTLDLAPGVMLTALPQPPTFTPAPTLGDTGRPTRTPLPLQGTGFVPVYQFMGAELLGVDKHNFRIEAVPADGQLIIQADRPNRWRWSIRPLGPEALGINRLEVQIYLPLKRSDGTAFRQETNLLPLEINVVADGRGTSDPASESDSAWLLMVAGVGGLMAVSGLSYGSYWLIQRRRKALKIFISYRRADSQGSAGRLYDRLARTFGRGLVFRDVDDIDYGADFVNAIDAAVGGCEVLIAVIGNQWLSSTDKTGVRRLDNPNDFVRLEIATALRRGIRVVPALVDDAHMPAEADLPDDLKELHRRNAIALRNDSFDDDVERLIRSLLE